MLLSNLILRFAVVLAICWFSMGSAYADNTVALLTGSGAGSGSGGAGSSFVDWYAQGNWSNGSGIYFSYAISGDVSNYQENTTCDLYCDTYFSGDVIGGTMWFYAWDNSLGPLYEFSGRVTAGSMWGERIEIGYDRVMDLTMDASFEGYTGTNGWRSIGGLSASGGCVDGGCGFYGQIGMTTFAPEPSSIALFGSGVLGLAGMLRRMLVLRPVNGGNSQA